VNCHHERADVKDNGMGSIETIEIKIFSYISKLCEIHDFIKENTAEYQLKIDNLRYNKLFIYEYSEMIMSDAGGAAGSEIVWNECAFESARTFDNIFFQDKAMLLRKIDYFVNNVSWYNKHGIPHTLGIALSGSPGTGKTSIIKALSNKLQRHIIIIPLSKIKTTAQLCKIFFETRYNNKNKEESINFNDKIIVFEDIDCMSDIVLSRYNKVSEPPDNNSGNNSDNNSGNVGSMVNCLSSLKDCDPKSTDTLIKLLDTHMNCDDKLTLSFILNLIDGIRETPGRILIITSNFYDKIDEALVRPGRIDITLQMTKVSRKILNDIYIQFFNKPLPDKILSQFAEYKYTPAEIVNYCINSEDSDEFISQII
jgi:SpoVK/Ycf46/Vps4 family AAA+-type ATPase